MVQSNEDFAKGLVQRMQQDRATVAALHPDQPTPTAVIQLAALGRVAESASIIAARLVANPYFALSASEADLADLQWCAAGGNLTRADDDHLGGRPSLRLADLEAAGRGPATDTDANHNGR